jgi:hypothetical protein
MKRGFKIEITYDALDDLEEVREHLGGGDLSGGIVDVHIKGHGAGGSHQEIIHAMAAALASHCGKTAAGRPSDNEAHFHIMATEACDVLGKSLLGAYRQYLDGGVNELQPGGVTMFEVKTKEKTDGP